MEKTTQRLITREADPYNSEPRPVDLAQTFVTPTELFYCRNHGSIPQLDSDGYRLEVVGIDRNATDFSWEKIKSFPAFEAPFTLQCAGNRRSEFEHYTGAPWQACAIGNALWKGLRLKDLLSEIKMDESVKHVHFVGSDETCKEGETLPFAMSIPIEMALRDETMLAYEMNGAPLTPLHGFPLRALVPGLIAARSVKWLKRIELGEVPSTNPHYARDYKFVPEGIREDEVDWKGLPAIASYQMTSAICSPLAAETVPSGPLKISGYAIAEGHADNVIERVEIRCDGEQAWRPTVIASPVQPYCWCLWTAEVDLSPGDHRLEVRAWDSRGRLQPQQGEPNLKGYLNAGWHSVTFSVKRET